MAIKLGKNSETEESAIIAEINITPLTDIFLILLIIFMVTSSVLSHPGVDIQLPQASSSSAQVQPEGVILTLLPQGRLRLNQNEVAVEDFDKWEGMLGDAFKQTSSRLVILEGDRQTFLGSAIEVMDHARRAGAEKFAIATSPEASK